MTKQRLIRNNYHGFVKAATWLLLLFATAFITNSCTKDHNREYVPVTEGEFRVIETVDLDMQDIVDDVMLLPDYPDLFDFHDFLYESRKLGDGFGPYIIRNQVVEYSSTDNHGNKIQLTGLMVHPISFKSKIYAPIVSFNHATQILKKLAPSKWKTAKYKDYEDFPEAVLANIMAATYGWIIVMPDYQGMGNDVGENHPFCIRERLAASTADMVQVAINSTSRFKNPYVIWNEKTFLYGYSEGGFVTMAAARELEARNVKLNGVVCMSGPYDLTGTMLPVMLKDTAFPEPYFLPMVIVGYHEIYPQAFAYDIVLNEQYRTVLPQYTNGYYDAAVVNSKMPPDKILKKIFTVSFIDSLKNPASQAMKIFALNNTHTGWTPKSKMYLWHCINDDCVPFGNFVTAKKHFQEIGLTNVDYKEYPALPPKPEDGTIHARIAPRAFFEGSLWIFHNSK